MTIRIEPQTRAHAEGLFEALQDERIYEFLDETAPKSVKAVCDRIERFLGGAPSASEETWLNWTVFEGDAVIGYTQATVQKNGTASFAYVLSPTVWGRSIAYAACVLTLSEIQTLPSVIEIVADTELKNARSQALLERLGFHRTHSEGLDLFYKRTIG